MSSYKVAILQKLILTSIFLTPFSFNVNAQDVVAWLPTVNNIDAGQMVSHVVTWAPVDISLSNDWWDGVYNIMMKIYDQNNTFIQTIDWNSTWWFVDTWWKVEYFGATGAGWSCENWWKDFLAVEDWLWNRYINPDQCVKQVLPVKWKSIKADVVNGEMRVDATSASAENVRDVELEVSVDGKHFFGVDREDAVNGTNEHTYTLSVSVRRLAQLLGITWPTVVYYTVKNNDNDGKSERSEIQAIEIHPDGFVQELKVFPNIASSSAQIKVLLPGDPQTEYTLHLYELTSGKLVMQNRKQGGAEVQLSSLMNHDLPPGQYFISVYGLATSAVTRFIITE